MKLRMCWDNLLAPLNFSLVNSFSRPDKWYFLKNLDKSVSELIGEFSQFRWLEARIQEKNNEFSWGNKSLLFKLMLSIVIIFSNFNPTIKLRVPVPFHIVKYNYCPVGFMSLSLENKIEENDISLVNTVNID